jgi:hypothetical protein
MFMDHAMKECEVANFHGQASDVYAYVSLHGIGVVKFSMKICYLTSVQCMTQVSKCYP